MRLFLSFLIAFTHSFGFASTETIIKADVIEGIQTEKNYFGIGGHFEKNANGWSGYDDAAATPADGTGGTVTTTCTRSTSSPLSGTGSFLYTPAALGEGCSYDITIDSKDKGKVLQLSLEYAVVSGTYTDDDTQIWIYDKTNLSIIQPAPYKLKNHSLASESFAVEFQTASSSTSYRILIHQATSGTAVLKFDNIKLGRQAKLYGSAITDFGNTYTPTTTNIGTATFSTLTGRWRKVGDSMELYIIALLSGAGSGASAFTFSLPSGYVGDSTKYVSGSTIGTGNTYSLDASAQYKTAGAGLASTTTINLLNDGAAGSYIGTDLRADTQIYIHVMIPIVGWSSSAIMSSDADTRVVAAKVANNTTQSIPNFIGTWTDVSFQTTTNDSHGKFSTPSYTIPVRGFYQITSKLNYAANATGLRYGRINVDGAVSGSPFSIVPSSGDTTTVVIGDIIYLNAGQVVKIQAAQTSGGALNLLGAECSFGINLLSGPSQTMASETVGALYTGAPPTGTLNSSYNPATFGTKVKDSHGAYSSGSYTVPVSGQYDIGATVDISHASISVNQYAGISIFIDGIQKYDRYVWCQNATVTEIIVSIDVKAVPLLAGQVVTIRPTSNGTTPAYAANAKTNNFYITRTGNY